MNSTFKRTRNLGGASALAHSNLTPSYEKGLSYRSLYITCINNSDDFNFGQKMSQKNKTVSANCPKFFRNDIK